MLGLPQYCPEYEVPCPQGLEEQDDKTCGKCFIEKHGSKFTAITYDTETGKQAKGTKRNLIEESLSTLGKYHFKTPDDIEALYVFREGEYIPGETFVKGFIESMFGDSTNTGLCGEVVNHLKRRSYIPRIAFNKFEGEIPVQNGLLNLKTGI